MATKKPHVSDILEAAAIDEKAAYFTACRRISGGKYDTRKGATLAEADALCEAMGAAFTMVYCVTHAGLTIAITDRNRPFLKRGGLPAAPPA